MSNRELAKNLIDQISDAKLLYVIPYLQGAALADETPNAETLEAMAEVQDMIESGAGEHFTGLTSDFLAMLAEG
ncbi:MAG: hypothetical protein HFI43_04730 [Lachnospiraceae bacterium]|jgi:hypothetical protein|nr:hypothetical protein [Lachnospiraceae bacterium]GFI17815.1 hypothetical protein IMSAGC009_02987 [Lachnospiraceae bacterium]